MQAGNHGRRDRITSTAPASLWCGHRLKRTLILFNYDWDRQAFGALASSWPQVNGGFDLFSFPSNARLAWFDMDRFVALEAQRARWQGLGAVVSNHEQFGALAAALLAERMGWPGTPVEAVLACQHKLHARRVLQQVCPEAHIPFARLDVRYGGAVPEGLHYPLFVKPVKAAFSVLARTVHSREELAELIRFNFWERWVLRHLVEPFDRVVRQRLPEAGTAHSLMGEAPVRAPQFCLDGYVYRGKMVDLGLVDARMYAGTQAFLSFDYPSRLPEGVRARAADVARRFLQAVGFTHGGFNMEFFLHPDSGQVQVIEFNPRLASQFSDLYQRVDGLNLHEVALALAHDIDPATLPRQAPTAAVASSFVYRQFQSQNDTPRPPHRPTALQRRNFEEAYPDALWMEFPMSDDDRARDFKWMGSHRYGIVHLGGQSHEDLRRRVEVASGLLGWPAPPLPADKDLMDGDISVFPIKAAQIAQSGTVSVSFP